MHFSHNSTANKLTIEKTLLGAAEPLQSNVGSSITLISVGASVDRSFPSEPKLAFCGNDPELYMKDFVSMMNEEKKDFRKIEIAVKTKSISGRRPALVDLPRIEVLDLSYTKKDLLDKIRIYWRGYRQAEGLSLKKSWEAVDTPGSIFTRNRPDLLAKLAAEADFRHLSVIIFEAWKKTTSIPPRFSIIKMALICDINSTTLTFHEVK